MKKQNKPKIKKAKKAESKKKVPKVNSKMRKHSGGTVCHVGGAII